MRRKEFTVLNHEAMIQFLEQSEYGLLSLVDFENKPYGVPLNFVYWKEGIVFHGAMEGKKATLLTHPRNASFAVIKAYSFIPSYFSHTSLACPATQFFGSVILEGTVTLVENLEEKANALNALMEKLQPEGLYEKISIENPAYTKMLTNTAVFYMKIEHHSFKLKIGQNLNEQRKNILIEELEKRSSALDQETLKLIRSYENGHTQK